MIEYPKLRSILYFPVTVEGKHYYCLHDPFRISNKPLLIPWQLVYLLQFLDGKHSVIDIQAEHNKKTGDLLFSQDITALINKLDHYLFLESERFYEYESKIRKKFIKSTTRQAFFAGLSYPSDPRSLKELLTNLFNAPKGPGLSETHQGHKKIAAIMAPNINIESSGSCCAWGYQEIARSSAIPELFIILGTCHTKIKNLFVLTKKGFKTPLGHIESDKEFIDSLQNVCDFDLFSDELCHRSEHAIEFQILYLQFIWEKYGKSWPQFKICPILCAFTPDELSKDDFSIKTFKTFVNALKGLLASYNKRSCIIVSANLAHLGEKFGDIVNRPYNFDDDKKIIDTILKTDKVELNNYMIKTYSKQRLFGYPTIITFLNISPATKGSLLNHGYSDIDDKGSIITYASLAFYE